MYITKIQSIKLLNIILQDLVKENEVDATNIYTWWNALSKKIAAVFDVLYVVVVILAISKNETDF